MQNKPTITINGPHGDTSIMRITGEPISITIGSKKYRFVLQNLCENNSKEAVVHYSSGRALGATNNLVGFVGPKGMVWPLCRYAKAKILVHTITIRHGVANLYHLLDTATVLNKS